MVLTVVSDFYTLFKTVFEPQKVEIIETSFGVESNAKKAKIDLEGVKSGLKELGNTIGRLAQRVRGSKPDNPKVPAESSTTSDSDGDVFELESTQKKAIQKKSFEKSSLHEKQT